MHSIKLRLARFFAGIFRSAHESAGLHAYHLGYSQAYGRPRPPKGYELAYFNGRKMALDMVPPSPLLDSDYVSKLDKKLALFERALSHLIDLVRAQGSGKPVAVLEHQSSAPAASAAATARQERQVKDVTPQAPALEGDDFVIPFGKFKGRTLGSMTNNWLAFAGKLERVTPVFRQNLEIVAAKRGITLASPDSKKEAVQPSTPVQNNEPESHQSSETAPVDEVPPEFAEVPEDAI